MFETGEKVFASITIFILVLVLFIAFPTSRNLEELKLKACDRWGEVGYECIGYEGYKLDGGLGSYGGAEVWHTLKRKEAPGIIYTGFVTKWGREIHIYGPEAVDAIKP